jgi:hypothetical protein
MEGDSGGGWTPSPWCGDLCIFSIAPYLCLRRLGVNLYIGSFTKVARFDVAKVVDANTGRFCPYGFHASLLT